MDIDTDIYQTLSKLKVKQKTKGPLSSLDSSGSVYINHNYNYKNPAKLIHDSIF